MASDDNSMMVDNVTKQERAESQDDPMSRVKDLVNENKQISSSLMDTISTSENKSIATRSEIKTLERNYRLLFAELQSEINNLEHVKSNLQQKEADYKFELLKRGDLEARNENAVRTFENIIKCHTEMYTQVIEKEEAEMNDFQKLQTQKFKDFVTDFNDTIFPCLEGLQLENKELNEELMYIADQISDRRQAMCHSKETIRSNYEKSKTELENLQKETEEIFNEIKELDREFNDKKNLSSQGEEGIAQLQNDIQQHELSNIKMIHESEKEDYEIHNMISQVTEAVERETNDKLLIEKCRGEWEEKIRMLSETEQQFSEKISKLTEESKTALEVRTTLSEEKIALTEELSQLAGNDIKNIEIKQEATEIHNNINEKTLQVEQLKANNIALQEGKHSLKTDIEDVLNRSSIRNEEYNKLQTEYENNLSTFNKMEEEHSVSKKCMEDKFDELLSKKQEYESELDEEKRIEEMLKSDIEFKTKKIEENESSIAQFLSKRNELLQLIQDRKTILSQKKMDNENWLNDLNTDIAKIEDEISQLTKDVEDLPYFENEYEVLSAKRERTIGEYIEENENMNRDLEDKLLKIKGERDSFEEKYNTAIYTLEAKKTQTNLEIMKLVENISVAQKKKESILQTNKSIESKIDKLKKVIEKQDGVMKKTREVCQVKYKHLYKLCEIPEEFYKKES